MLVIAAVKFSAMKHLTAKQFSQALTLIQRCADCALEWLLDQDVGSIDDASKPNKWWLITCRRYSITDELNCFGKYQYDSSSQSWFLPTTLTACMLLLSVRDLFKHSAGHVHSQFLKLVVSQEQKEGTTRKLLIYRDGKLLDITGHLWHGAEDHPTKLRIIIQLLAHTSNHFVS